MKPGPKPGSYWPTRATREKMRQAKLGTKRDPETRRKIQESLSGLPKSLEHRDNLSHSLIDVEGKCALRLEELKATYPDCESFFEANYEELLFAMQDVRSEKELQDLRHYVEVAQIESKLSYTYSSSSVFAAEDTIIDLLDAYHLVREVA